MCIVSTSGTGNIDHPRDFGVISDTVLMKNSRTSYRRTVGILPSTRASSFFFSAVDRFLMVRIHVRQPGFVISYLQEALMLLWEVFAPPFG